MSTAITTGSLADITKRDNLSLAESFLHCDAILIVDMSSSMGADDAPGGISRYDAAEKELRALQREMPGKIAVVAFSGQPVFCPGGVPARLGGTTDMAAALKFVLPADGLAQIVLISDGQPDSERETLAVARRFTSRIDTVYIGPADGWAASGREFLAKLAAATGGRASMSKAPGLLQQEVVKLLAAGAIA